MEASTLSFIASVWGLTSALGVAALGAFLLTGGKARLRGSFAFGSFAILWALQVAMGHTSALVGSPSLAVTLQLAGIVCLLPIPYLLVEFAAAHDARPRSILWPLARATAAVAGGLAALLLVIEPALIFQTIRGDNGVIRPLFGPLHVIFVTLPYFAALGLTLLTLERSRRAAPTPRTRSRAATLVVGLGLFVAYTATNNLGYFAYSFVYGRLPADGMFFAVFAGLTLVAASTAIQAWREARHDSHPDERRVSRALAIALAFAMAWGSAEIWLALGPMPLLQTSGLWRLVAVGIIAYGIARWRVYDLPQRATSAAATAGGVLVATAGGAAAYGAGTLAASGSIPAIAGVLVLGATLAPSISFARRLLGIRPRSARTDLEESLYGQRLDAYRAALESSMARGTLDEDAQFLAALRERFGITQAEERVLLHYARGSVIVPRDQQAWDAYERLRLLGEGGAGRTWLARDRARDRLVVLKEPLAAWHQEVGQRDAVLREARLAAKVRHPNVVLVESVVDSKAGPVIVMEYLEGGTLRDLLQRHGTLPWPQARQIALDVLAGLDAIHAGGIVHRDIKPSNVLLTGEGHAKVADFGIAVRQPSGGATLLDAAQPAAGTIAYMAPEARAGTYDRRSDVYGVGVLLHEMLYGAPPEINSPLVMRQDLPASVPALVARALARDPAARPPTARALAEALSAA